MGFEARREPVFQLELDRNNDGKIARGFNNIAPTGINRVQWCSRAWFMVQQIKRPWSLIAVLHLLQREMRSVTQYLTHVTSTQPAPHQLLLASHLASLQMRHTANGDQLTMHLPHSHVKLCHHEPFCSEPDHVQSPCDVTVPNSCGTGCRSCLEHWWR